MGTSKSRSFVAASSQYLDVASAVVSAPPFTMAGWFKPVSAAVTYELATLESNTGATKYVGLLQLSAGAVRAVTSDGTTTGIATATGAYTAGRWNHAAAVFTGIASRAAFLNGAGKGTDTTSIASPTVGRTTIGRLFNSGGAPTQYLDGNAAQIAIWNVALSDSEVALLASGVSPLRIQRAALIFYAPDGETVLIGTALTNNGPTISSADPSDVQWTINSVDRTTLVRKYETTIDQNGDGSTDQCTLVVRGFTPTEGMAVQAIYHNDRLFTGVITDVELIQTRASTRARYRCQCMDQSFLFNRRLVLQSWTAIAADTIATAIISGFSSGFTSTNVQAGLASVDFASIYETPSAALQRLANAIGGRFKVRYDSDIYFRTTSNLTNPVTLDANNPVFRDLAYRRNIDQVRTRLYVEGDGSDALVNVPPSVTVLPLRSVAAFSASGGTVRTRTQRPTYTGISTGGAIAAPVGTWSLTPQTGAGGSLPVSTNFSYKITYYTAAGESTASAASSNVNTGAGGPDRDIIVGFTPTTGSVPSNITGWAIYASDSTSGGAGPWHLALSSTAGNAAMFSQLASGSLGSQHMVVNNASAQPPSTSTAGNDEMFGSTTSASIAVGSTTVSVTERGHFNSGGGLALVTVNGTPFVVKYTGKSSSYGTGALTGVPASGFGSVLFTIASGTAIQNVSCLIGLSGNTDTIYNGDRVVISAQRDDATAQTALAASEGGDGIHEFPVNDSALSTLTGCNQRGDAELTAGKSAAETATCLSEDQYATPGGVLTLNIAGISTNMPIANARISWTRERKNPQRQITATSQYKTLYQYLADLQRQATT